MAQKQRDQVFLQQADDKRIGNGEEKLFVTSATDGIQRPAARQ